ncbi:MAG TPA: hypothetical protein VGB53_03565 [Rubricoccaceae bacterium]
MLALVAALGTWFYFSSDRVWGTPFYTCLHGCTRYLALSPCRDAPPTTDYVSGDGCGLGSGVLLWIDECKTELTVYGLADPVDWRSDERAEATSFVYEQVLGEPFRQKVLDNEACIREVVVP